MNLKLGDRILRIILLIVGAVVLVVLTKYLFKFGLVIGLIFILLLSFGFGRKRKKKY